MFEAPDEEEEEEDAPERDELKRVDGVDEEGVHDEEQNQPWIAQGGAHQGCRPDRSQHYERHHQNDSPVAKNREDHGADQEWHETVGECRGIPVIQQRDPQREVSVMKDLIAEEPDVRVALHRVVGKKHGVGEEAHGNQNEREQTERGQDEERPCRKVRRAIACRHDSPPRRSPGQEGDDSTRPLPARSRESPGIGPARPWVVPASEAPVRRSRAHFNLRGVDTARR